MSKLLCFNVDGSVDIRQYFFNGEMILSLGSDKL